MKGTDDLSLFYPKSDVYDLKGFSDADYVEDLVNKKSTLGMVQFLGSCLVSWCSKKQNTVALSTAEAEYVAAAAWCFQTLWIKQQLRDFGIKFECVPIYCDNTSAICISKDPVHHSRLKQIHIRHHFLKDNVENKNIIFKHVNTIEQIADIMTKPLPREQHGKLRLELGMIKLHWSMWQAWSSKAQWKLKRSNHPQKSWLKNQLSKESGTQLFKSIYCQCSHVCMFKLIRLKKHKISIYFILIKFHIIQFIYFSSNFFNLIKK